jgi:hypothetical protein
LEDANDWRDGILPPFVQATQSAELHTKEQDQREEEPTTEWTMFHSPRRPVK